LGRSGQRETLLSLPWLGRKPATFVSFAADIVTPFALYALVALAVAHGLRSDSGPAGLPFAPGAARVRSSRSAWFCCRCSRSWES
jgi:hypothetical protein